MSTFNFRPRCECHDCTQARAREREAAQPNPFQPCLPPMWPAPSPLPGYPTWPSTDEPWWTQQPTVISTSDRTTDPGALQ